MFFCLCGPIDLDEDNAEDENMLPPFRKSPEGLLLPPKAKKHGDRMTVVLAMDETLLHTYLPPAGIPSGGSWNRKRSSKSVSRNSKPCIENHVIRYMFDGEHHTAHCILRPGVKKLIKNLSENYELIIFSGGDQGYTDACLDLIDPERKYVTARLYSHHLSQDKRGKDFKEMELLGRDMKNLLLVDNNPDIAPTCPDNLLCIKSFTGDEDDEELISLEIVLEYLKAYDDVRKAS